MNSLKDAAQQLQKAVELVDSLGGRVLRGTDLELEIGAQEGFDLAIVDHVEDDRSMITFHCSDDLASDLAGDKVVEDALLEFEYYVLDDRYQLVWAF